MTEYFLNIYLPNSTLQIQVCKGEADSMIKWYKDDDGINSNYELKSDSGVQRYTYHFKRDHINLITVWERPCERKY